MKLIFITQVYSPDPAAVGQHFEDAAIELAKRGHRITVYTADRDYDNPKIRYDSTSRHPGVRIVRMPFSSFGKRTIFHRLLGQASFLSQVLLRLLFCKRPDGVVLTTIPATTGAFFLIAQAFRHFDYLYWVMDINPDQAVALKAFDQGSVPAQVLAWINRKLVKGARRVVCLDRDMADRLYRKLPVFRKSAEPEIIPPWPLEGALEKVAKPDNPFVAEHNLGGRFVFMYSGNHSMVHPLDTLLDGIEAAEFKKDVTFAFIGGGRGKQAVEARIKKRGSDKLNVSNSSRTRRPTLLSLPYQPLDRIKYSLSAADIQVVSFGDAMIGIVHPCKFYGAMVLGQPILLLGSKDSALGRIVTEYGIGWCVPHGNQKEMIEALEAILDTPAETIQAMGERAKEVAAEQFSQKKLCGQFCDTMEATFSGSQLK